jgi:hypothetical protein
MKRNMAFLFTGVLCISLFSLTFTSCEEDPEKSLEENIQAAGDLILAEITYFDVYNIIDKAARDSTLWNTGMAYIDSAEVLLSSGNTIMEIIYGPDSVLCPDGKYRRGTINVLLTGDYLDPGTVLSITFSQYYVGHYNISGTQTVTNIGLNSSEEWEVEVKVDSGRVTGPDGSVIFSTIKTLAWIQGQDTPEALNDDIYIARTGGTTIGSSSGGVGFQVSISSDIRYERICEWISSGIFDISLSGLSVTDGTIDFGDGTCDSRVMVKFEGVEVPFYMD